MTSAGLNALSFRSWIPGKGVSTVSSDKRRTKFRGWVSAAVAYLIIATGAPLMGEHDHFQEPSAKPMPERAGVVTGHVYCGDTHELARFATVTVQPLTIPGSTGKDRTELESPTTASTDLNGKFTVSDLLPGSYLVLAWLPGYVSPLAQIKTDVEDSARLLQTLETVLPRIEVNNHSATTIDITLARGAVVTGSITYDDGSPAVGFHIKLLYPFGAENSGQTVKLGYSVIDAPGMGFDTTDDRGQYRLSGLPPGSYVVAAISPTGSSRGCGIGAGSCRVAFVSPNSGFVQIYSGNEIRLKNSKAFPIVGGEQRSGVDIVVPLNHLHQVAGKVVAKSDRHLLRQGFVQLLYADDRSVAQRTRIQDDGTFVFDFVQNGGYLLKVVVAAEGASGIPKSTNVGYREQIMPLDVDGNVRDFMVSLDD